MPPIALPPHLREPRKLPCDRLLPGVGFGLAPMVERLHLVSEDTEEQFVGANQYRATCGMLTWRVPLTERTGTPYSWETWLICDDCEELCPWEQLWACAAHLWPYPSMPWPRRRF